MPPYLYHLAFQLDRSVTGSNWSSSFQPAPNLNIFSSELPVHSRGSWSTYAAPLTDVRRRPSSKVTTASAGASRNRRASRVRNTRASSVRATEDQGLKVQTPSRPTSISDVPRDWRNGDIAVEGVDMSEAPSSTNMAPQESLVKHLAERGLAIKGKYIPSEPQTTDLGEGVVHLYRDQEPSSVLAGYGEAYGSSQSQSKPDIDAAQAYVDNELTTLCILAVPSYMTPSDLLGWVGEENRDKISHFRLIRTGRSNKYMVLLKFREAAEAKQWQRCWNGRLFNSMEPENCHVVFVRSIQFQIFDANRDPTNFPDMTNDPFKPTAKALEASKASHETAGKAGSALTGKPAPPPTPSLLELPTCPVCLERMDETTGLATIFCQHVFHCTCLQKWRGSGCPVCRYTQDDLACKHAEDKKQANECETCGSSQSLWICLICGHTGCGRYEDAHAFEHYTQTTHAFAMDIATQHIWDYIGDEYVHRLIQSKTDNKLIELPSSNANANAHDDDPDVPTDKLENMSLEYSNLLTSQLTSQRTYFSEQVERAVDKASRASLAAEEAAARAVQAYSRLETLEATNVAFANDTVPTLERDLERAERRAQKAEGTARHMQQEWREKGIMNDSLMERIVHLEKQLDEAQAKVGDLEEQNRDLSFFISGMEKLRDAGEDVLEGKVSVGDAPATGGPKKKKKKGKAGGQT